MMGAVHAGIGAAVGSLCRSRLGAFVAGVASHILADITPHTDSPIETEIALLGATVAGIAAWKGTDSPEFWGALGGIAPDVEHGLLEAGVIEKEQEVFPTHGPDGKCLHGGATGERWTQALIAVACFALIALKPGNSE